MTNKDTDFWRRMFFFVLIVTVLLSLIAVIQVNVNPTASENVVVFHSDHGEIRVFYSGAVKNPGITHFDFIGVCNLNTNECRDPTEEEVKQNRYLP